MSIAEVLLVQAPIAIENALVPLNYGDYLFFLCFDVRTLRWWMEMRFCQSLLIHQKLRCNMR
jgi:hypothetical protein